jgi:4-hydroxybutyrate CoA-transferase
LEKQKAVYSWLHKLGPSIRTGIVKDYLPYILDVKTSMIDELARMSGVKEPTEVEKTIAGYLSTLINDRDCIQIGVGSPASFMIMCGAFDNKHDLGLHTEMACRGLAHLVEEGIINGKYKTYLPEKAIATSWAGCHEDEFKIFDNNPKFELYDMAFINRPDKYMMNDNMVAINNAVSIDLTGQVNAETRFGPLIINGTGGQPETHIGCLYSKGGKSIHLLRSTAVKGSISTIVGHFEPGTAVTIPKYWADYVVSEYGIARLMGKTLRERAGELIAIAHPNFRTDLKKEALKLF